VTERGDDFGRQPEREDARWLAEWLKTYQESISRWQRYVRTGGLEKLRGEDEGWVLTPEMRQAILEIWVPNFWLSANCPHLAGVALGLAI